MPFPFRPSASASALARALTPRAGGLAAAVVLLLAACGPIVRPARFASARDRVTDVTLAGPFDGQVIDENTGEPIQGATVVGVWSYDEGDGLVGPSGSEVFEKKTDQAGRYRIPVAPRHKRGSHLRLVSFQLVVYKRGYVGYRSDRHLDGSSRSDFTLRHNRVLLRKWRDTDSHAQHLVFLAAPATVAQLSSWEREAANVDLYRELGGERAGPSPATEPTPEPTLQLLDARAVLPPEDVRRRTGYTDAFEVKELGDLARTHFYHGVHLQAVNRDEVWDVAVRVWKNPPGGLQPVIETFEATLPQVPISGEITAESWVYDGDDVRAVAFLDRERNVGVLITCGAMQCADIETAIILASFVHDNLDALQLVEAPSERAPGPPGKPGAAKIPTTPPPADPSADEGDDDEDEAEEDAP